MKKSIIIGLALAVVGLGFIVAGYVGLNETLSGQVASVNADSNTLLATATTAADRLDLERQEVLPSIFNVYFDERDPRVFHMLSSTVSLKWTRWEADPWGTDNKAAVVVYDKDDTGGSTPLATGTLVKDQFPAGPFTMTRVATHPTPPLPTDAPHVSASLDALLSQGSATFFLAGALLFLGGIGTVLWSLRKDVTEVEAGLNEMKMDVSRDVRNSLSWFHPDVPAEAGPEGMMAVHHNLATAHARLTGGELPEVPVDLALSFQKWTPPADEEIPGAPVDPDPDDEQATPADEQAAAAEEIAAAEADADADAEIDDFNLDADAEIDDFDLDADAEIDDFEDLDPDGLVVPPAPLADGSDADGSEEVPAPPSSPEERGV